MKLLAQMGAPLPTNAPFSVVAGLGRTTRDAASDLKALPRLATPVVAGRHKAGHDGAEGGKPALRTNGVSS